MIYDHWGNFERFEEEFEEKIQSQRDRQKNRHLQSVLRLLN